MQNCDHASWFFESFKPFSVTRKPYTVVADLDELVLTGRAEKYGNPKKFNVSARYFDYKVDPAVFAHLREFQSRGYQVMVVTTGSYRFKVVEAIFAKFGVTLLEAHYHNRAHIERKNFLPDQKAEYIDALPDVFTPYSMLFDNTKENKPKNHCLFYHVDPHQPFPDFEAEFCSSLKQKLASYKKQMPALKFFIRTVRYFSKEKKDRVLLTLEKQLIALIKNHNGFQYISTILNHNQFFRLCDHMVECSPTWSRKLIPTDVPAGLEALEARLESYVVYKLFQLFPSLLADPVWANKKVIHIKLQDIANEARKTGFFALQWFSRNESDTKKVLSALGVSPGMLTTRSLYRAMRVYTKQLLCLENTASVSRPYQPFDRFHSL